MTKKLLILVVTMFVFSDLALAAQCNLTPGLYDATDVTNMMVGSSDGFLNLGTRLTDENGGQSFQFSVGSFEECYREAVVYARDLKSKAYDTDPQVSRVGVAWKYTAGTFEESHSGLVASESSESHPKSGVTLEFRDLFDANLIAY